MTRAFKRAVRIVEPGMLSAVQDLGRRGVGRLGVSPSGAADWYSERAANRLVGNADGAALIESTLSGATFVPLADAWVAVTGADASLAVGGRVCEMWRAQRANEGDRIVIGRARHGLRSYIAFDGGLRAPMVMGSLSTDVTSGFGGRVLARGDEIELGSATACSHNGHAVSIAWREETVLRTAWRSATLGADALFADTFTVGHRSSRQALVLEAASPIAEARADLPSAGVCAGCVQVTGDGTPIVLLCEHQTTGGYDVVAVVAFADLPLAAQLRPGERVRFAAASMDEADIALDERRRDLDDVRKNAGGRSDDSSVLAAGFFEGAES